MMGKQTAGSWRFWYRLLPAALGIGALFSSAALMYRMLWFDEVLTVDLLTKLPWNRIYFAYEIPNNHIVFTLLEKCWYSLVSLVCGFSFFYFRLVPMLCGAAAVFLLGRRLIRSGGLFAGSLIAGSFAVSPVYGLYATAVRGYMTGFLLTVLAMLQAEKVIRSGRKRDCGIYFLLALLSVGTAPTNLAALAGIVLFLLPQGIRRGRRGIGRLLFLALAPGIALGLFYGPILEKFLGCIRLGEGWQDAPSAIYVLYTGALFPWLPLLICCLAGGICLWIRCPRLRLNCLCGSLTLVLPAAACLVMKVPPFPRVFFPLVAVWIFSGVSALSAFFHLCRRRRKTAVVSAAVLQAAFCLLFFQERAEIAGDFLYGAGGRGDDYIAPYYVRPSFAPQKMLEYLKRKYDEEGDFRVFATFDSDAPSLVFGSMIVPDFPAEILRVDTLNRPKTLQLQDYPGRKYVICSGEPDLNRTLARFGLRSAGMEKAFGPQQLYRVTE